jgi:flagellar biosynthesis GTPase FlhF
LLTDAVEELYSADPEDFTGRRAELVAQARSAGQAGVARQIAALRKPTRSAWVINQLTRTDPEAVSRLAGLGAELRAAERARDGGAMRELSQARRRLIAGLVRQALAAAGQQGAPAALREDVTATLAAAMADPEVAGQIRHGTLLRPARRAGFGTEQGPALALVPPPAPARQATAPAEPERAEREPAERAEREPAERAEREPAERAEREPAERAEREPAAQEERERAEAERERQEARAAAERALADADQAAEATRAAEQELADTLRRLEQQVADLRRRLLDARTEARQAQIVQRKARQALARLPE